MNHISVNGKFQPADQPALLVSNRGYRYGDGLFETMKLIDGRIQLEKFHFERLFYGLSLLKFEIPKHFTPEKLREETAELCKKNNCEALARVRLSVYRGNGGLYDEGKGLEYIIESWPLDPSFNELNEKGLVIGIYPDARKSCDEFSNLKSANGLPYSMAALYAKEKKWNDCLLMNSKGTIADSTIANIFIIKDGVIITPPLEDGCVNGVMRRHLIAQIRDAGLSTEALAKAGYAIREESITQDDLENADEIFLTNAIRGIRWVKQFGNKIYSNKITLEIFKRFGNTVQV